MRRQVNVITVVLIFTIFVMISALDKMGLIIQG